MKLRLGVEDVLQAGAGANGAAGTSGCVVVELPEVDVFVLLNSKEFAAFRPQVPLERRCISSRGGWIGAPWTVVSAPWPA